MIESLINRFMTKLNCNMAKGNSIAIARFPMDKLFFLSVILKVVSSLVVRAALRTFDREHVGKKGSKIKLVTAF